MAAVMLTSATTLAACGGAAVDNSEQTSIPPLTRSQANTAAASSSSSTSSASVSATVTATGTSASASAIDTAEPMLDQGQQISGIPATTDNFSAKERAFIDQLTQAGVDVTGVEAQMLGAAGIVCVGETEGLGPATVQGLAGQLIEQGRTSLDHEHTIVAIETAARSAYC